MSQAHIRSILPQRGGVSPVDNNTVALFHFDEDARDSINGIKPIGELHALDCNGTSTYAGIETVSGDVFDIKNAVTIEAWINARSFSTYNYIISKNDAGGGEDQQYGMTIDNGKAVYTSLNGSTYAVNYNFSLNRWYHVAMTWDGTTHKVYVDGKQIGSRVYSATLSFKKNLSIGRRNNGLYFDGFISNAKIWSKGLTEEELIRSMNNFSPVQDALVGYWKLNENEGQIAYDTSNNGNDLIIYNQKWGNGKTSYSFGEGVFLEEETTNLIKPNDFTGDSNFKVEKLDEYTFKVSVISVPTSTGYYVNQTVTQTIPANQPATISVEVLECTNPNWLVGVGGWGNIDTNTGGVSSKIGNKYVRTITHNVNWSYSISLGYVTSSNRALLKVGDYMIARYAQIEQKAYATSFVDGSRSKLHIQYPNPITGASEFTVSVWIKPVRKGTTPGHILTISNLASDNVNNLNIENDGVGEFIRAYFYDSNGIARIATSNIPFDYNNWMHISVTKDSSKLNLYVNGVLAATHTSTAPLALGNVISLGERIGSTSYGGRYTNMIFDELRLDKIARTPEEIQAWYYQGRNGW